MKIKKLFSAFLAAPSFGSSSFRHSFGNFHLRHQGQQVGVDYGGNLKLCQVACSDLNKGSRFGQVGRHMLILPPVVYHHLGHK